MVTQCRCATRTDRQVLTGLSPGGYPAGSQNCQRTPLFRSTPPPLAFQFVWVSSTHCCNAMHLHQPDRLSGVIANWSEHMFGQESERHMQAVTERKLNLWNFLRRPTHTLLQERHGVKDHRRNRSSLIHKKWVGRKTRQSIDHRVEKGGHRQRV
jgi:hypothetical protein